MIEEGKSYTEILSTRDFKYAVKRDQVLREVLEDILRDTAKPREGAMLNTQPTPQEAPSTYAEWAFQIVPDLQTGLKCLTQAIEEGYLDSNLALRLTPDGGYEPTLTIVGPDARKWKEGFLQGFLAGLKEA
jgi:hypothetical protein